MLLITLDYRVADCDFKKSQFGSGYKILKYFFRSDFTRRHFIKIMIKDTLKQKSTFQSCCGSESGFWTMDCES